MKLANLRTFLKFLSRNKLYTFISIFGFSVSLMFVIILAVYIQQETSVDDFQKNKDRIFIMTHDGKSGFGNPVAPFIKDNCPEVEEYVRMHSRQVSINTSNTSKFLSNALFADSSFFKIFSIKLLEGNSKEVLNRNNTAVLTQSFAHKMSDGRNLVGTNLIIDSREFIITGIMEDIPKNTMLPDADFVLSYSSIAPYWGYDDNNQSWVLETAGNFGFIMFFMTQEGTSLKDKEAMLLNLFKENFWYYKEEFTNDLKIHTLKEAYYDIREAWGANLRTNNKTTITVYMGIAILILIISLLNYINMTVAQSGFRGKETAIKKLLGAEKFDIFIQLLQETFLITAVAFIIGIFLALAVEPFFNNVLSTTLNISQIFTPLNIVTIVLFVVFISFIAGIVPATIISNFDPLEIVKGSFNRKVKTSYSKILIIFQYTVAILLLVCSFLIIRQVDFMMKSDTGFIRERIVVFNNVLGVEKLSGFKSKLYDIAGVEVVSYSNGTPATGSNNTSFELHGEQFSFQEYVVDSSFFKLYGISIESTDVPATRETYWINQVAYKMMNIDTKTYELPLGHERKALVAGITNDFKERSMHSALSPIRIKILPDDWLPWNISVKIVENADFMKTMKEVEKVYKEYSDGELFQITHVDEQIKSWYEKEEKTLKIISAFTILTILITIMGVFAMSLYQIRQREKEIGIRKVNGATEMEILKLLNKTSVIYVVIAFLIACPIAYYVIDKWLEGFAYKVSITPIPFLLSGLAVLALTTISVSWITWRAARTNPVDILKNE